MKLLHSQQLIFGKVAAKINKCSVSGIHEYCEASDNTTKSSSAKNYPLPLKIRNFIFKCCHCARGILKGRNHGSSLERRDTSFACARRVIGYTARSELNKFATLGTSGICAITASEPHLQLATQHLATQYLLPMIETSEQKKFAFILVLTEQGLILQNTKSKNLGSLQVDFLKGKIGYRLRHVQNQKQLLAKAIGNKINPKANILDLTAGLGNDGFVLAQLGFSVTLLERSPIIAALLNDGLHRALNHEKYLHINIQLIHTSAANYLKQIIDSQELDLQERARRMSDRVICRIDEDCEASGNIVANSSAENIQEKKFPEIIYLDPMYPHSSKSASVKKEMRFLREIVGDDIDAETLLPLALKCAQQRVVVKRPRLAAFLAQLKPHHSIFGKQLRFDIYLANNHR